MHVYENHAAWAPERVRPKGQLVLRFILTVLYTPVQFLMWLVALVIFLAVSLVTEIITVFSTSFEQGLFKAGDRVLDPLAKWPSWCVSWPELRHEGDTAYYRARVEKAVGRWTKRASVPRDPKKPRPPVECAIPLRDYRGVGGAYVAQVAVAQGWELRPTDVRKEVRLWWSAASHVD
ncbi:membrane protein [Streptomyces sp. WM6386]|uniref:membrane protein n=1 Tax=Streptomyces sp. WM6386 TaxID=1415558 RepID=UPI000619CBE9|nr:membrane protein [Streptomyces sp. WM6386]KKD08499.1 membrane protein [Streptomyces sp. WM6386]